MRFDIKSIGKAQFPYGPPPHDRVLLLKLCNMNTISGHTFPGKINLLSVIYYKINGACT